MKRFAPLLLILGAAAAPAQASEPVVWQWERATPMCSLIQAYSADGRLVQLSRSPADGDGATIRIGREKWVFENAEKLEGGKVAVIPGGEVDSRFWMTDAGGYRQISASNDDPEFLDKLRSAQAIELRQEKIGSVRIPLRSAAAAVEAIRKCEDSRMRQWGIDPVGWRALKSHPRPVDDWYKFIGPDDYPAGALLEWQQGFMILRFNVGPDGKALDCMSVSRRPSPNNPNRLCPKLKRKMRFEPAVSATGQPVASPYVLIIRFRIEGLERPFGTQDPLSKDSPTS